MGSINENVGSRENTINNSVRATENNLEPPKKAASETISVTGVETIDAEKGAVELTPKAPPRDISGIKWAIVVLSILSSTFLFALDNTIMAVIQPVIVTKFNSVDKLAWLSVAFLIGAAATNLVWGKVFSQLEMLPQAMLQYLLLSRQCCKEPCNNTSSHLAQHALSHAITCDPILPLS